MDYEKGAASLGIEEKEDLKDISPSGDEGTRSLRE